ncbi:hypothetical protein OGATHE_006406 [Ogataea polymorpha]|uniref:Uncharacterized protein n=1 Tax=Ogataea polymorpha TaxID=460523 RepID=A0A9P8NRR8_9ASCO|nr:hypothetical protein OGATHE_006406 [Ogataea polymorpha]
MEATIGRNFVFSVAKMGISLLIKPNAMAETLTERCLDNRSLYWNISARTLYCFGEIGDVHFVSSSGDETTEVVSASDSSSLSTSRIFSFFIGSSITSPAVS